MKRLDMKTRKAILRSLGRGYKGLLKKEKGMKVDEAVSLMGYHRSYAAFVLRKYAEELEEKPPGVVKPFRRRRKVMYDTAVQGLLKQIWVWMDCICGKRLGPQLPSLVTKLVQCGELKAPAGVLQKLRCLSPPTIDRLLASEKAKSAFKSRSRTKPGTLLKSQIPIRTFADWNDHRPGFVEIDLVGHDGGDTSGDYAQTLDVTDVASGWTETQAVPNKAQIWVLQALKEIHHRFPFPLLGIDSDNGSEFINDELMRYCTQEHLTFTRSRPYRKNDTCFVEQKNWSIVRRAVGYNRYDTPAALILLNALYHSLRLYTNFFQPNMKLIEKTREGAHVIKHYDKARTPMARLMDSSSLDAQSKRRLKRQYDRLNPVALRRNMDALQHRLAVLSHPALKSTINAAL